MGATEIEDHKFMVTLIVLWNFNIWSPKK